MDFKGRWAWRVAWGTVAMVAFFVAVGVWSATGFAGVERAGDRAAIEAVLQDQQAAWNRGDVDAFLTGYWRSPELTFSGSSGITRGWDGVRERYKTRYAAQVAMGQLEFSQQEFHFLGPDAALVLGHWQLRRAQGDIGGVFSLVWQKFPEGWRIIHDHTSQAPPS